jgi:hypothetical protein
MVKSATASSQEIRERIESLLNDLPPESLYTIEQFARFLRYQRAPVPEPYYPTVLLPASSLDAWTNLLSEGYEGDALLDSEALYDED